MSHLTYLTKDRHQNGGAGLPIRFIEQDQQMYVPVDMWKTYHYTLSEEHIFVVTNKPRTWIAQGYLDFEGLMYPPIENLYVNLAQHGSKIYRYFIGIHHFGNGSIKEL